MIKSYAANDNLLGCKNQRRKNDVNNNNNNVVNYLSV